MKSFLEKIESKLNRWNIRFPHWAAFNARVVNYYYSLKDNGNSLPVNLLKVVCDTFDMVTYNAYAFMGMLLCALILF